MGAGFDAAAAGPDGDGKAIELLATTAWLIWHVGSMPGPAGMWTQRRKGRDSPHHALSWASFAGIMRV